MAERLSNKELTKVINEIERDFDVNTIRYKGINFWPFIRVQLVYIIWNPPVTKSGAATSPPVPLKETPPLVRLYKSYMSFLRSKRMVRKKGLWPGDRSDFLFVSENIERKELMNGKRIHPFANTIDTLLEGGKYTILDYNYNQKDLYYGDYAVINYIPEKVKLIEELRAITGKKLPEVENMKRFERFLSERGLKLRYAEDVIRIQLEHIYLLSVEFEKLFRKMQPKAVFFTVFFKEMNFAVSLACRRMGIKAVEIQHGQQGMYSPQNNGFAKLPANGYELLPSHFWVWGKDAAGYKQDLCSATAHSCIIAGNPWLNAWLPGGKFAQMVTNTGSGKPGILVALQPVEPVLPEFLLQVIGQTEGRFTWRFRLHPAMKSRLPEIEEMIGRVTKSFDLRESTEFPLYQVLKSCKFVITQWSTVAYEGLYFGLRPLIIHKNGRELMQEYIEKGFFGYADNSEELLNCLLKKVPAPEKAPAFIETDLSLIRKNLNLHLK